MSRQSSRASTQRGTSLMLAPSPSEGVCDTACCCVQAPSRFRATSNRPAGHPQVGEEMHQKPYYTGDKVGYSVTDAEALHDMDALGNQDSSNMAGAGMPNWVRCMPLQARRSCDTSNHAKRHQHAS